MVGADKKIGLVRLGLGESMLCTSIADLQVHCCGRSSPTKIRLLAAFLAQYNYIPADITWNILRYCNAPNGKEVTVEGSTTQSRCATAYCHLVEALFK